MKYPLLAMLLVSITSGIIAGGEPPALRLDKPALAWALPWEDDWVSAVCFVSSTRVAAGNEQGAILIWDLPEKADSTVPLPTRKLDGHTNGITRLLTTPDGRWLISASKDRTIRIWDLTATPTEKTTVIVDAKKREAAVKKAGKNPPAPKPGVEVANQKPARSFEHHKEWILGLALSKDGKSVLSGDDAGQVMLWDFATGKVQQQWKVKGWVFALAMSPTSSQALISERIPLIFDSDRHVALKIWDAAAAKMERDLGPTFKGEIYEAAAFSPDGKTLAIGRAGETEKGKIHLIEASTGKKTLEIAGHLGGVNDLAFAPDGKHLLSCGRDTVVRVWNVADGKQIAELGKPRGGQFKDVFHALSLSPDQRFVAAADMAGQVQIFRLVP